MNMGVIALPAVGGKRGSIAKAMITLENKLIYAFVFS